MLETHLAARVVAAEAEETRQLRRAAWRYLAIVAAAVVGALLLTGCAGAIDGRQTTAPLTPLALEGRWLSDDSAIVLTIQNSLAWTVTSTFGGRYRGSGSGEIVDGRLVLLRGSFSGDGGPGLVVSSWPITFRLVVKGDALVGEYEVVSADRLSRRPRTSSITLSR